MGWGRQWRHKQCKICHPTPLSQTICMIEASRHIPGLPHISDEHGQDIRQWHSFSLHKGGCQCIQGGSHPHNLQRQPNSHWHSRLPMTLPNTVDAIMGSLATTAPIQTSTERLLSSQQHLQSPINQASHQMDARHLWIPGQINFAQSHQSGQLRGLANAD